MTVKPVKPLSPTNQKSDTSEKLSGSKRKSDIYMTGSSPTAKDVKTKKSAEGGLPSPSKPPLSRRALADDARALSVAYKATLPQLTQDEYLARAFAKDKSLEERTEALTLAMMCPG